MDNRKRQIERDRYYMGLAWAVRQGADCRGTTVGAVVVMKNRVVSTGYNGTPDGFLNCREDGCVRCKDRWLEKNDRAHEMSDPTHKAGQALDRCVCVHAEQNAFITAARFGIAVESATLYTTTSPCFGCLKEAVQAGVSRIVYDHWYAAKYSHELVGQYCDLYRHLMKGNPSNFEAIGGNRPEIEADGEPDPYVSDDADVVELEPPPAAGTPRSSAAA